MKQIYFKYHIVDMKGKSIYKSFSGNIISCYKSAQYNRKYYDFKTKVKYSISFE